MTVFKGIWSTPATDSEEKFLNFVSKRDSHIVKRPCYLLLLKAVCDADGLLGNSVDCFKLVCLRGVK